jgi:phage-related tail protein
VEGLQSQEDLEAQQVRIRDLENDLQRTRASLDAQLGLLPASGESSGTQSTETVSVTIE